MNDLARVWVEDRDWRVPSWYRRCRMLSKSVRCPNAPVADLARKRAGSHDGIAWFAYCGDHLYGRRLRDGKVYDAVAAGSPAATQGYIGGTGL